MKTRIEWTDHSLGAARMGIYGCSHTASRGCDHCWAEALASRFEAAHGYPPGIVANGRWTGRLSTDYSKIIPAFDSLPKRKGCRVFAPSSGDLLHEQVPPSFAARVIREFSLRPHLTGQILTKRPERVSFAWNSYIAQFGSQHWPPNVWIGGSFSTQADLDRGLPDLLRVPAAVRFLSLEPLLEPVRVFPPDPPEPPGIDSDHDWAARLTGAESALLDCRYEATPIDWIIIGAESGPHRRPCRLEWVRAIVEQCDAAGTAVFVKQLEIDGRLSRDPAEWPPWARRQEDPR